jgi:predicted XRE-type DNA-binding protein
LQRLEHFETSDPFERFELLGQAVTLYSLDGSHWDSDLRLLGLWHKRTALHSKQKRTKQEPESLVRDWNDRGLLQRQRKARPAQPKKVGHHNRKFSTETVDEIRSLHTTGNWTQTMLAEKFGVAQSYVSNLVHFKVRARPAAIEVLAQATGQTAQIDAGAMGQGQKVGGGKFEELEQPQPAGEKPHDAVEGKANKRDMQAPI